MTWSAVEANVGIICASLILIKPLLQKVFPNMLSSSAPSRRNLHLPTIHCNGTQSSHAWSGTASNVWTCTTILDSGGKNTVSGSDGRPTVPGINVMVDMTQTSASNSRASNRENDLGTSTVDVADVASSWTKAWDEQDSVRKLQDQSR